MDSLHAIGFYVSSGVLLIGGLGVALLTGRELRGVALAVTGVGLGGLYVSLAAGFAAVVALICYLACGALIAGPRYRSAEAVVGPLWRQTGAIGAAALLAVICYLACGALIAGPRYRAVEAVVGPLWRQAGAIGAAALLAVIVYAAFRGDFVAAKFFGGAFGVSAVGRLLFAHDALATEAVAALVLVTLVGATAVWRVRERAR